MAGAMGRGTCSAASASCWPALRTAMGRAGGSVCAGWRHGEADADDASRRRQPRRHPVPAVGSGDRLRRVLDDRALLRRAVLAAACPAQDGLALVATHAGEVPARLVCRARLPVAACGSTGVHRRRQERMRRSAPGGRAARATRRSPPLGCGRRRPSRCAWRFRGEPGRRFHGSDEVSCRFAAEGRRTHAEVPLRAARRKAF